MNVKIIRGAEVNRPEPDALTSSVLDHATVVNKADFGLRNNEGLWPSYNCIDTLVPTPICPDPVAVKEFGLASWMPGFEFAYHGGVKCSAVGLDKADQLAEVKRVAERNEGKGIEQALLLNRFVANPLGSDETGPEWDAPVDVSVAAMTLPQALAALEGYAAAVYAGVPTIHMPRAAASLLNERIVWKGDLAYTRMGSKVAFGGGYDSDTVPPSGTMTMFATGEVYVERSEDVSVQTFVIPGDGSGTGSDGNGLTDNTVVALSERMFRVGVDCFVASATGTAWP